MKQMAKERQMSKTTMLRLCKDDLKVYPYKLKKYQLLSDAAKQKRPDGSKKLLRRNGNGMLPNHIFSNEKLFTVEAAFNHRNDIVLSKSLQDIPSGLKKVRRTQKPAPVMVWAAASSEGQSTLIFLFLRAPKSTKRSTLRQNIKRWPHAMDQWDVSKCKLDLSTRWSNFSYGQPHSTVVQGPLFCIHKQRNDPQILLTLMFLSFAFGQS